MLSGLSGLSGLSAVCGGAAAFDPTTLSGYVDSPYSIAALRGLGKLWQDAGKTVAATADGDPVRVVVCGSTDYTAPSDAARPLLWSEGGGKWSLSFDGVDDRLYRAALLPTGTGLTIAAAALFSSTTGTQCIVGQAWNDNGTVLGADGGSMRFWATAGGPTVSLSPGTPAVDDWATMDGIADLSIITSQSTGSSASAAFASDPSGPSGAFGVGSISLTGGSAGGWFFLGRIAGVIVLTLPASGSDRTLYRSYLAALAP